MRVTRLSLTNFRNYRSLELSLPAGLLVFHGANGQGKSNLLEAVYLLSIARSHRATTDLEMVHWEGAQGDGYALVHAEAQRRDGPLTVRMGLQCVRSSQEGGGLSVQKHIRVNGVPRRAWDLVGQLNAVLFSADDIELVRGAPSLRRRYLDVLLSQVDGAYLRALQQYGRVLTQRNHLLRMVRDARGQRDELAFWDGALAREGGLILERRLKALADLAPLAREVFHTLTGFPHDLEVSYAGTVRQGNANDASAVGSALEAALVGGRAREIALGMTLVGPHRDDLRLTAGGVDLSAYASRGQARLLALALRLAEARFLEHRRGEQPVLLLDDVLSELDAERRRLVLEAATCYQQAFLTTVDLSLLGEAPLSRAHRFRVAGGSVAAE